MSTDVSLTDDAEYMLCVLYEAYKQRRKGGMLIEDASFFGGAEFIQSNYTQQYPTGDITEAARELEQHGFVNLAFGDEELVFLALQRRGVAFMEHRFANNMDKIVSRISDWRKAFLP